MSTRLRYGKIDWQLILTYLALIIVGWVSVFSSVYDEESTRILDFSQRHGMQLVWICASFILAYFIIFILNPKLYNVMAWWLYAGSLILLTAVIFLGVEINGSKSWFMLGPIRFQPAEISKITTSLALASMMSAFNFRLKSMGGILKVGLTILIPMLMIILEKETGSALIYTGFVFMLYREGLSGWFLSLGLLAILLFLITLSFSPFIAIIVLFAIVVIAGDNIISKEKFRSMFNGVLVQDRDSATESIENLKTVTSVAPTADQSSDLIFANKLVKHSKSNAIVLAKNKTLIASGIGQTSRVDALKQAIEKAGNFGFSLEGSVMASDAFFPFPDCVEIAHKAGVTSVIQPGGSVRDQESVDYCNANGLAMVVTGTRHFKH